MKQLILLTAILMISTIAFADDTTTTQTCADGVGEVITGVVSDHKYCRSNAKMNWWNAYAWCDALGRRLFSLDDCKYSSSDKTTCPDLKTNIGTVAIVVWSATPRKTTGAYTLYPTTGGFGREVTRGDGGYAFALCY